MAAGAVWITGAGGFAGRWLLQLLRDRGRAAAALVRRQLADAPDLPWAQLDLETAALAAPGSPVARLEGLPEPCGLIHLAAWSHPAACEAEPGRALQVNVAGPARLYEQVLARWPRLPVLHVSSAYVYRPQAERLREEQAGEPENAYGASKLQGEAVALGLRDRGFRVRVARPFNHSGPGQAPRFALPSFALRIARLEAEGGGRLPVGPLDGVRDFLHVRDVVRAYLDLLDSEDGPGIVNVCSGEGVRIGDLLAGLLRRSRVTVEVVEDPERLRGAGAPRQLVGDPGRLRAALGWSPRLEQEAFLDEILADARKRLAAGEDLAPA